MGFTTEHRGRGPKVFVPGTRQFLSSTCIRTNQSSKGIIYSAVLTKRIQGSNDHNQPHFIINIKSDKTKVNNVGGILGKVTIRKLGKSLARNQ